MKDEGEMRNAERGMRKRAKDEGEMRNAGREMRKSDAKDEGRRMKDESGHSSQTAKSQESTATPDGSPGGTTAVSSESGNQLSDVSFQLSSVEQIAKRLVQRDPTSLPHRTLLALVYLKENRPATALGVYENLHVPPNALTPSALAVHAAVLEANGNTADAAKEAAQIPRSVLLPEEERRAARSAVARVFYAR